MKVFLYVCKSHSDALVYTRGKLRGVLVSHLDRRSSAVEMQRGISNIVRVKDSGRNVSTCSEHGRLVIARRRTESRYEMRLQIRHHPALRTPFL